MLTFSRRKAHLLHHVLRRTFGTRGAGPSVYLTGGPDGLSRLQALYGTTAIEYCDGHAAASDQLGLPFSFLADCAGKSDEPIEITSSADGQITAQWRDRGIPQLLRYQAAPANEAFPNAPDQWAENPPNLLAALADASRTTDPASTRFALGCLQLRPDGSIAATDGRQLLVQNGFAFPWTEAILTPASKLFGAALLPTATPVYVGRALNHVVLRVGPWTFWLPIDHEARFPKVDDLVRPTGEAIATLDLTEQDGAFLAQGLPRLPGEADQNQPVTLDLNGRIALRAQAEGQPRPTELLLSSSTRLGESIRFQTDRRFLCRALELGLRQWHIFGPSVPLLACNAQRSYVWAPLDPSSALPPVDDAISIESPPPAAVVPPVQNAARPRARRSVAGTPAENRTPTLSRSCSTVTPTTTATLPASARPNGAHTTKPKALRRKAAAAESQLLIEQADKVRLAIRALLSQASELVRSLKQHRRANRAVQTTLASLRQLTSLGV